MPRLPTLPGLDLATLLDQGALGLLGDADLLDRFDGQSGHRPTADRAFAMLVERHGGMVLRVARGRVDSEADAADVFQATFLLLARRSRTIRRRDALGAWLFGVASRVATRANLDAARRQVHERRAAIAVADSTLDPARSDHDLDLAPAVRREVDRLPDRHRAAVVLCDLEGLPLAEVARRLGCPVGTVKGWASRGRSRLRARLAAQGFAPPGCESRPLAVPLALVQSTCRLVRLTHCTSATAPRRSARSWP